ncbi:MAG: sulfate adenylyltransferase subunit CysD [Buchnera aphidicola (Brevicoryne brassicae)]|uniref:Sulfate adenylyltransferase subunit 2 n=1 Tax=Buchnera aphidicola (Brevicoryne brassicae) TaxID=911343 RepID=A0AAJ5PUR1_9GAMM|nr:sulfate adenylyltransferase subunit CysD [Buchnera aphidicola]QCI19978.1 sulfate adenylyltransferase subunit CysD [Buchnera aphidicola (Brevicoryne brassicae)]WAI18802.1 MAG: sulfate adenylyltransferase subunit CysD [Buchnera aphidicola (Brevicoryne brassicae)]
MFKANTTHLRQLESESIYIMREVISEFENPVMLYSIGKDSSVMLHLAKKSFYPGNLPFPLLHIDTGWKFKEMYKFRDYIVNSSKIELIVHSNSKANLIDLNPFKHGGSKYTDVMKTEGLKEAINKYNFDAAFGGARRDEEKSRSKERIYSFRDSFNQWDPKKQRPELWWNYNGQINKGENIRVFPLSNWTELDIWQYIFLEKIEIVPLYFASMRPVVERDGALIMIDDKRIKIYPNEIIKEKMVRFRTLGCWPLTSAIESEAKNLEEVIMETLIVKTSERTGRAIDHDQKSSMELKKRQGYF